MRRKFKIEGMSCAACSASVEKAVLRVNGVRSATVSLLLKSMDCDYDETVLSTADIVAAVEKIGFSASVAAETDKPPDGGKSDGKKIKTDAQKAMKPRLLLSVLFLIPLLYISMGHMLKLPLPEFLHGTENAVAFAFSQFVLTLPIVYANKKFFSQGLRSLFLRAPNMDTLVAVGSGAALVYGVFSIYMIGYGLGHGDTDTVERYMMNLYFESAAMILTLVTVGKFLEERSKGKTGAAIKELFKLSPETVAVLRDGREEQIPAGEVAVGDVVVVRPGERIPVDGVVEEGASAVDESALTGESIPAEKMPGDAVMSASIAQNGRLLIKARRVGKDTTLSQIIALVEDAGASKAPVERLADKVSGVFVPIVIGIALLSVVAWLLAGQTVEFALSIGIAVLVISCPCALGLATPVAVMVATGRLASEGILVKSAEALETLHAIDTVVLDKTGTLTEGKPAVTDVIPAEGVLTDELLRIAASLETGSEHPLAKAVLEYSGELVPYSAERFITVPGRGVAAEIDGIRCIGGNAAYMTQEGVKTTLLEARAAQLSGEGKTLLWFARETQLLGIIAAADTLRETSAEAVASMKALGVSVTLLTGDSRAAAEAAAKSAGIDNVIAEVLPADKEKVVSDLKRQGKKVAMVGDGINDSPALAAANVGIAVGRGADIALEAADIVLMRNDLRGVARAVGFSKKAMSNIRQNLFWAFFYNALGIPVAAGILYPLWGIALSPMIGAAAMSFSSVFVVSNALRLNKTKK